MNYSDRDNGALSSNTRHCAPLECRNQFRRHLRKLGISIAEFATARTIRLIAPYKEWWAVPTLQLVESLLITVIEGETQ